MLIGGESSYLHIMEGDAALCGRTMLIVPAEVNRDSLFCGPCWDRWEERTEGASAAAVRRHADYLNSDIWQRTRRLALEFYGGACCLCNSNLDLNVHHRTYERLGDERLADLIVLCRDCHAKYHGKVA